MSWAAYPPSSLSKLDSVTKLLEKKDLSEYSGKNKYLVNFLFKQNEKVTGEDMNDIIEVIAESGTDDQRFEEDEQPPAKVVRVSSITSEATNASFSVDRILAETLEKGGNVEEVVIKMPNLPEEECNIALENAGAVISEKGVTKLVEFLSTNDNCDKKLSHLFIQKCLTPALMRLGEISRNLMDSILEVLQKYPDTIASLLIPLMASNKMRDLTLMILQSQLMKVSQQKAVLIGWIASAKMNQSDFDMIEIVVKQAPKILDDDEAVHCLVVALSRGADSLAACPNFAKLLLFLIKKMSSLMERNNYDRLVAIVSQNKTFLKRAMQNELKKRNVRN